MVHLNGTVFCGCNVGSHVRLYRADDLDGGDWTLVMDIQPPPAWLDANYLRVEDPYFYMDPRGNFHLLTHSYDYRDGWPPNPNQTEPMRVSGHAYSPDGLNWTFDDESPFFAVVKFDDGTQKNYSTFERPHLIFDDAGEPTHLVNGVSPFWLGPDGHPCSLCDKRAGSDHSCVVCKTTKGIDWTYTLVQPLVIS
jgi:hypothetical protein